MKSRLRKRDRNNDGPGTKAPKRKWEDWRKERGITKENHGR